MMMNMAIGQYNNTLGSFGNLNIKSVSQADELKELKNELENQEGIQDTLSISPQGQAMSNVNNLMKQKLELTESKNELISNALENGEDMSLIEDKIKSYDEKIANIDAQIASSMTKDMETTFEKQKKAAEEAAAEAEKNIPKTEEEVNQQKLNNMFSFASDLDQIELSQSIKSNAENQANILETQAKYSSSGSEEKLQEAAELDAVAASMDAQIGDKLNDVNARVANTNGQTVVEESEEKAAESDEETLEIV